MFLRGPNPIWFMNDLVGQPLDDSYYAFFLTNDLPYLPQAVYQDPAGTIPWSDPIEFQPSAGLPNNLYFDPNLTYRIEIRQGPTQVDPLIWLIENYTVGAGGGGGGGTSIALTTAENMITNPQFADIYFVSPLTITTAGTTDIGPGWQLITTGSGSTTITQIPNPGSPSNDGNGNPPYYLTISSSGWTSSKLVQRFANNGAIFSGGAIAAAITGASTGTAATVSIIYAPSVGAAQSILSESLPVGPLTQFTHAIDLPDSGNTDSGNDAYVDIEVVLPNAIISITNIQITGQSLNLPMGYLQSQNPLFQEQTYERIVDHEFHVYRDSILRQPKESLLAGWNFGLNPWQFRPTAQSNVVDNTYTADQTIVIQQNYVAANVNNNISVGRASFTTHDYAFQVASVTSANQFALLQYIDPSIIRPYWGQVLSSLVTLLSDVQLQFKMRLIYKAGLPNTLARLDPIATWTSGQDPQAAGGYTLITPPNDPVFVTSSTTDYENFAFENIQLPSSTNANMTLGILLYTINNVAIGSNIYIRDISLVPNRFAIATQSETFDVALRKCQFYFEKSYDQGIAPGTPNNYNGVNMNPCKVNLGSLLPNTANLNSFYLRYKQTKRSSTDKIKFYSPATGTIDRISVGIRIDGVFSAGTNPVDVDIANWSFTTPKITNGDAGVEMICQDTSTIQVSAANGSVPEGIMEYHYTIDARLGA